MCGSLLSFRLKVEPNELLDRGLIYPSRSREVILQDLARFLQKRVILQDLARWRLSCKILQDGGYLARILKEEGYLARILQESCKITIP